MSYNEEDNGIVQIISNDLKNLTSDPLVLSYSHETNKLLWFNLS